MKPLSLPKSMMLMTAILSGVTGCKFMSGFSSHTSQSVSAGSITQMPRVTTTDLDATGGKLLSAGLKVTVKRPEIVFNNDGKTMKLPQIIRPFEPSKWNHMIAAQDPAPGTALQAGAEIVLTAGMHHGAGPFRPWLEAHGWSVSWRGDGRCKDCHGKEYCSDCHAKLPLVQE